jgi:hypothetical protein
MTTQPVPRRPHRAHLHTHVQPPVFRTTSITISPTVMPAHVGIQRLGSCGVRS